MARPALVYKLDDFNILNEDYVLIEIGTRQRVLECIRIEELAIGPFYDVFVPEYRNLLYRNILAIKECQFDLSWMDDQNQNKEFVIAKLQGLLSHKLIRNDFIKLLKRLKLLKMRRGKALKLIHPTQLGLMFYYLYKFNVDNVKKKFMSLLEMFDGKKTAISEIFTTPSSNLDFCPGQQKVLKPRYRRLPRLKT